MSSPSVRACWPITNGAPGALEVIAGSELLNGIDCVSATTCYAVGLSITFPYVGVIATITEAVDETSLTCVPGTSGSGAPINICTVSDPNGVRTVQIYNSATDQKQAALAFNCASAPTSVEVGLPAGTRYKVTVTGSTAHGSRPPSSSDPGAE